MALTSSDRELCTKLSFTVLAVAGGVAGERANERVVAVGTLSHEGGAAVVSHTDEQVALRFIALRERHVIGLHESLQQISAGQVHVLFTELMEVNLQFLI